MGLNRAQCRKAAAAADQVFCCRLQRYLVWGSLRKTRE
jgi:hypothetical protein